MVTTVHAQAARPTAAQARARLRKFSSLKNAETAQWFFKTGDGCYGAHDRFVGVRVPDTRRVAREFRDLRLQEVHRLLRSKIHEERLLALVILVERAKRASADDLRTLSGFYVEHLDHVNNWDLVDVSAEHLLGAFLFTQPRAAAKGVLLKLARDSDLWRRRVSVIATFYFIRRKSFALTFRIARQLLADKEDLIHKAAGWMLREVGNRDMAAAERFLKVWRRRMPRTMLRYAIEKFPHEKRLALSQRERAALKPPG
jgi:3-methyladenine DNA glycosylase AlkD